MSKRWNWPIFYTPGLLHGWQCSILQKWGLWKLFRFVNYCNSCQVLLHDFTFIINSHIIALYTVYGWKDTFPIEVRKGGRLILTVGYLKGTPLDRVDFDVDYDTNGEKEFSLLQCIQVEKSFLWNEGGCRDVTSWKRRGTRRCLYRDRKSLITPSLHLCLFLIICSCLWIYWWCNLGTKIKMFTGSFIKNKDVGMGLSMTSCLGIGIFLFPFFFMKWHPYIPLHFREMIFPLVPLTFFIWGKAPIKMRCIDSNRKGDYTG